LELEF